MQSSQRNSQPTSSQTNAPAANNKALLMSLAILRAIGYILLVFVFLEAIDTLIPPQLTNPGWEFQTIGRLVETVPIVFLAFGLILVGREISRDPKERYILRALPWLALIIGILYFLTIPIGILNTTRLLRQNNQQIVQVEEGRAQVNQIRANLEETNSQADLERLLQDLGNENPVPQLEPEQIQEAKDTLTEIVQGGENQLNTQTQRLEAARVDLLKKSVKWNLGAFLSGVLFIYIWRLMRRRG